MPQPVPRDRTWLLRHCTPPAPRSLALGLGAGRGSRSSPRAEERGVWRRHALSRVPSDPAGPARGAGLRGALVPFRGGLTCWRPASSTSASRRARRRPTARSRSSARLRVDCANARGGGGGRASGGGGRGGGRVAGRAPSPGLSPSGGDGSSHLRPLRGEAGGTPPLPWSWRRHLRLSVGAGRHAARPACRDRAPQPAARVVAGACNGMCWAHRSSRAARRRGPAVIPRVTADQVAALLNAVTRAGHASTRTSPRSSPASGAS